MGMGRLTIRYQYMMYVNLFSDLLVISLDQADQSKSAFIQIGIPGEQKFKLFCNAIVDPNSFFFILHSLI